MDDDVKQFLNDDILSYIRRKAKQLAGKYGFHRDEIEDIQQRLILDCLQRVRRFDSRRGPRDCFARHVVKHGVARLIESQRATRRGYGIRLCSLNAGAEAESPDLAELISEDGCIPRRGWPPPMAEERLLLRLDVANTVDKLPADLRQICHLLTVMDGVAQVAAVIGISRATLHRRIRLVRSAFEQVGFRACRGRIR